MIQVQRLLIKWKWIKTDRWIYKWEYSIKLTLISDQKYKSNCCRVGISNSLVKLSYIISKLLSFIIKQTLTTRIFPTKLKLAKVRFFKSWYTYLNERVFFNRARSYLISTYIGAHQGSVLGPLLFSIYINDMLKSTFLFNVLMYADETTLSAI